MNLLVKEVWKVKVSNESADVVVMARRYSRVQEEEDDLAEQRAEDRKSFVVPHEYEGGQLSYHFSTSSCHNKRM